ncbi:MAG: hypothetical protein A3J84_07520 [Ignavibacteria bacterium RIFOXYA2_FULL_37_17]|nr:MAG: hypothetical protein A2X62_05345 [Stygiobacter sp. GWC2_38_9]OGU78774.1 MAG: hypothetical protein A2279_04075 [Stygiobacter sp. RIFOXYA12_FULL_38_9]OGV07315.1 MAG: hypothetical protein A2299_04645 [Stygiobacter sp. RIFOXYB2_FULL_37_11]OGV15784.1 MAG: hypothetical protein A2440_01910 [Stygiobacter sp. RIFOXYC2_FULL_38_25]OGV25836.1 MAG: hypothetical protein A3J84_07520 [Ignavibacteria bacterium RIFOXYA2_FULL_37_17]OGV28343.1 MAG: hypothetical protein A2499_08120 [Stygiobacter sp. RIFOXY
MKEEQDYIRDIAEIRSMMERSSKFASLSGLSGILAGIYALAGAFIVYHYYSFNPDSVDYTNYSAGSLINVIAIALIILILALGSAVFLSYKKGNQKGEKIWNTTSRRLIANMAVPLSAGGILILIFLVKGLVGLIIPSTLLFYGLAIYNASKFTFGEMKFMGLLQIGLGLISAYFIEFSLFIWAFGFGVVHIAYGTYMHFKYERR